jgi:hypothetical protein
MNKNDGKKVLCETCKFCRAHVPVEDMVLMFEKTTYSCQKEKFSGRIKKLRITVCDGYEEDVEEFADEVAEVVAE